MYYDKNRKSEYIWYAQRDVNLNKVHYLYANERISGKCFICNLYRVLKVR